MLELRDEPVLGQKVDSIAGEERCGVRAHGEPIVPALLRPLAEYEQLAGGSF